ncbi:Thymidylate kinase [subsurface metagenome]
MKGKLIIFSGLDGAGKSTQIEFLIDYLRSRGRSLKFIWTRGGYTSLFNGFKNLLRKLLGKRVPPPGRNEKRERVMRSKRVQRLWLIIALLDLLRVYAFQIRFWLWFGKIVICDRYLIDTLIDFKINFRNQNVERWFLYKLLLWASPRTDISFLMLIPVEESLKRSSRKREPFPDSRRVLVKRLSMYQKLLNDKNCIFLDGLKSREELTSKIKQIIDNLLS